MSADQTPTVFVAVLVASNQFDLFSEILSEAIDVLNEHTHPMSGTSSSCQDLVMLDRDNLRMALGWSSVSEGDVLTLAVGTNPDQDMPGQGARFAADMLKQIVARAEALFEVKRTLWQVALMPLNAETIEAHAEQLDIMETGIRYQVGTPFVRVDLGHSQNAGPDYQGHAANDDGASGSAFAPDPSVADPSWVIQASALALSTTFVLVTPPVGLAMFTYAALRQSASMDLIPRNLDFATAELPWFSSEQDVPQQVMAAE